MSAIGLYASSGIVRLVETRMGWAGRLASTGM
jgi:hypothetical protein